MKVADSIKITYSKTEWREFIRIIINFKVLQKVKYSFTYAEKFGLPRPTLFL